MNKIDLLAHCKFQIEDSIHAIISGMKDLVSDADNDCKSSAGDKHETGRAMMQQALEQMGKQLQEAEHIRSMLQRIEGKAIHQTIGEGSLVQTNESLLFLSAPLGKINFNGHEVFAISLQSPLGKILLGKKVNESVEFNNRTIQINNVS